MATSIFTQGLMETEGNPFENGEMDIPKAVYKFRDWTNDYHKDILKGEIYFPSPLDFNDPFDCNIPVAYELLQDDEQLRIDYFTKLVNTHKGFLNEYEKKNEIQRFISEGRYRDPEWLKWQARKNRENLATTGVFCFSMVKDNILLWSHYANSHKGFCVGFNPVKLFYELFQNGVGGGYVRYSNDYPVIMPGTDVMEQIYIQVNTKSNCWAYEEEYRMDRFKGAKSKVVVQGSCIEEVNLGCAMSERDKESIMYFINVNIPHVKVFQAYPVRNRFQIDFEQIK